MSTNRNDSITHAQTLPPYGVPIGDRSQVVSAPRRFVPLRHRHTSDDPHGRVAPHIKARPHSGQLPSPTAVFLDFDGTIADHNGDIAPSTIDAIRGARDNGHLIFLSTGRSRAEISSEVYDIGFDGFITAAGGFAHLGDELVFSQTMPQRSVERIIEVYADIGVEYCLQYVNCVYVSAGLVGIFAAADRGEAASLIPRRLRTTLELSGVAKSVFASYNPNAYDTVRTTLADEFTVITGTLPQLGTGSGEISLPHTHKAAAIPARLKATGIPRQATLAIGDSTNDIDMLRYCHTGIAMGNAPEHAHAAADENTTSVTQDGIFNAFRRHQLLTTPPPRTDQQNPAHHCGNAGNDIR